MSAGATVTACMIVKNEAAHLARCLTSLKGAVDEVVIVDTGSVDATVAIAEAFATEPSAPPVRLGRYAWTDDFAAARNAALELGTRAWALSIDADEELVVADLLAWREALAGAAGAYTMRLDNLGPTGDVESGSADALRLFRLRPDVRYKGRLHEQVESALVAAGLPIEPLGAAWIRHFGYVPAAMPGKADRNRRLAELEARDRPNEPVPWLYTAQAAWLARDMAGTLDAVSRARAAVLAGGPMAATQRAALALLEAWARQGLGQLDQADGALEAAIADFPSHPELRYERGRRRVAIGDAAGAHEDFMACLAAHPRRTRFGTIRSGVTGFLAHIELMGVAATRGDLLAAADHAEAAAEDPACPRAEAAKLGGIAAKLRAAGRGPGK